MYERLRILDLFSGIGGFTLSLDTVASTIAFCDKSTDSKDVLRFNMDNGNLQRAHIFDDVCGITSLDLKKLKPNMLTAGFPCTDISAANPTGNGLKGERSGLFKEIVRLIDIWDKFDFVFLENSPRIKDKGLGTVCRAMRSRGYIVKYTYAEAISVGAHHKRKRWFCLCTKPGALEKYGGIQALSIPDSLVKNKSWDTAFKGERVIKFKNKNERDMLRRRCALLGNSVVPQVVRAVWNTLLKQDTTYKPFVTIQHREPLGLKFKDAYYNITRKYWATPVYTTWHNYSKITYRGIGLLSNQCFYEEGTKISGAKNDKYAEYTCNPVFVEWLMGYPKNWTRGLAH